MARRPVQTRRRNGAELSNPLGMTSCLDDATILAAAKTDRLDLFESALRVSSDGFAILDTETLRFVEFNDAECWMHGYTREEFAERTLIELSIGWTREDLDASHAHYGKYLNTSHQIEVRHRCKDGREIDVRVDFCMMEFQGKRYSVAFHKNITAEKQALRDLAEREMLFRRIVSNSIDGLVMMDATTLEFIEFNDVACRNLGYSRDEFSGLTLDRLVVSRTRQEIIEAHLDCIGNGIGSMELFARHGRKDGSVIDVHVKTRFLEMSGRWYAISSWTDITAKLADERALQTSERQFRMLVENSPDAIIRFDRDLRRIYCNPAYERLTGWSPAEHTGLTLMDYTVLPETERYIACIRQVFDTANELTDEFFFVRRDGRRRWASVRLAPEIDSSPDGTRHVSHVMAIIRDITDLIEHREAVRRLACTDTLTGLPNRSYFNDEIAQVRAVAQRTNQRFALMFIDLDHFKDVNDGLGHGVGDRLLIMVAERLKAVQPPEITLTRLGGDEFALLVPHFRKASQILDLATDILDQLAKPFLIDTNRIFITASVGTAIYPDDGEAIDEIVASADAAMYDAKRKGRNNHQFYLNELVKRSSNRLSVIASMHSAISRQEFELYYQPQLDIRNGKLLGAEALIRWNHPTEGQISPINFIPIAEETGLIIEIGRWALHNACETATLLNTGRSEPIRIAVNLSSRQFLHHDLVGTLRQALMASGADGRWLELEITESLMLDDHPAIHRTLAGLKDLGARIAIDDFGTGHSALGYLDRFQVDVLKIDRSFTSRIVEDPRKAELARTFIAVSKALGIESIAEGVETAEQADLLAEFGCRVGQGYLYGRPAPRKVLLDRVSSETTYPLSNLIPQSA